ncbi:MAG TPA: ribosome silencing factor [Anaerolineae bacterium]|nr:ribosome silencing factor [Anaerolineae bacterium]
MINDLDGLLAHYVKAVMGKKATDLVVLDVRGLTSIADFFIICSGSSTRQVMAIAESIKVDLKKHGIKTLNVEGIKEGRWVLLDYGHIIIHVFYEPLRGFYDLEGLWTDAKRVITESMAEEPTLKSVNYATKDT